ncbi:branched-chain amino acid ABC transporter substrate-binding protein [Streptomyces sp. NPDC048527]|uniref:branched-chain amino acid ABC transporter substrate-binding protein n=1 Tax=Streptomyces sp. NPDC048527 TaxID=3365568 RepID=UPI0037124837
MLASGLAALTACSAIGDTRGTEVHRRTLTIGVDAPLSGPLAGTGKGIMNSVDLAIQRANTTHEVPGVTFRSEALDDKAMPHHGQVNAGRFVRRSDVIGIVGPLNSRVALSMQKPLDQADLVMVSPANTNPALTLGPDWLSGHTQRPNKSYFRTVATDVSQGPYAAQFAFQDLHKRHVFVIDDDEAYGRGLTSTFTAEFTRLGGKVSGTDTIKVGDQNFSDLVTRVANSGAEFVFCGGAYPECGRISRQLKTAGADLPLMGGDAMYEPAYMAVAGDGAEGDVATSVGAPVDVVRSARAFVTAYKIAGYATPPGTYGGYAYDSAWAIVEAVKGVAAHHTGALPAHLRSAISTAMPEVTFSGVTGPISFDTNGDATNSQLTVCTVRKGKWVTLRTGTYVS